MLGCPGSRQLESHRDGKPTCFAQSVQIRYLELRLEDIDFGVWDPWRICVFEVDKSCQGGGGKTVIKDATTAFIEASKVQAPHLRGLKYAKIGPTWVDRSFRAYLDPKSMLKKQPKTTKNSLKGHYSTYFWGPGISPKQQHLTNRHFSLQTSGSNYPTTEALGPKQHT